MGPENDNPPGGPDLSVIAPAHNERDNVERLVDEVGRALTPLGIAFEFIIVDDGSTDDTRERVVCLMTPDRPWLRCIAMTDTPPGRGNGQSAAFHAGFRAARGRLVATLDADLQNDPADLPAMLELMRKTGADFVQGDRSHARRDNAVRRVGSVVGRLFRRVLLGDAVRDTGCSLRVFDRKIALLLPLELRGMHRFIPVMARDMGARIVQMRVNHRARVAGETKYGLGVLQRAIPGLVDCFAVRYMRNRRRPVACHAVDRSTGRSAQAAPESAASETPDRSARPAAARAV